MNCDMKLKKQVLYSRLQVAREDLTKEPRAWIDRELEENVVLRSSVPLLPEISNRFLGPKPSPVLADDFFDEDKQRWKELTPENFWATLYGEWRARQLVRVYSGLLRTRLMTTLDDLVTRGVLTTIVTAAHARSRVLLRPYQLQTETLESTEDVVLMEFIHYARSGPRQSWEEEMSQLPLYPLPAPATTLSIANNPPKVFLPIRTDLGKIAVPSKEALVEGEEDEEDDESSKLQSEATSAPKSRASKSLPSLTETQLTSGGARGRVASSHPGLGQRGSVPDLQERGKPPEKVKDHSDTSSSGTHLPPISSQSDGTLKEASQTEASRMRGDLSPGSISQIDLARILRKSGNLARAPYVVGSHLDSHGAHAVVDLRRRNPLTLAKATAITVNLPPPEVYFGKKTAVKDIKGTLEKDLNAMLRNQEMINAVQKLMSPNKEGPPPLLPCLRRDRRGKVVFRTKDTWRHGRTAGVPRRPTTAGKAFKADSAKATSPNSPSESELSREDHETFVRRRSRQERIEVTTVMKAPELNVPLSEKLSEDHRASLDTSTENDIELIEVPHPVLLENLGIQKIRQVPCLDRYALMTNARQGYREEVMEQFRAHLDLKEGHLRKGNTRDRPSGSSSTHLPSDKTQGKTRRGKGMDVDKLHDEALKREAKAHEDKHHQRDGHGHEDGSKHKTEGRHREHEDWDLADDDDEDESETGGRTRKQRGGRAKRRDSTERERNRDGYESKRTKRERPERPERPEKVKQVKEVKKKAPKEKEVKVSRREGRRTSDSDAKDGKRMKTKEGKQVKKKSSKEDETTEGLQKMGKSGGKKIKKGDVPTIVVVDGADASKGVMISQWSLQQLLAAIPAYQRDLVEIYLDRFIRLVCGVVMNPGLRPWLLECLLKELAVVEGDRVFIDMDRLKEMAGESTVVEGEADDGGDTTIRELFDFLGDGPSDTGNRNDNMAGDKGSEDATNSALSPPGTPREVLESAASEHHDSIGPIEENSSNSALASGRRKKGSFEDDSSVSVRPGSVITSSRRPPRMKTKQKRMEMWGEQKYKWHLLRHSQFIEEMKKKIQAGELDPKQPVEAPPSVVPLMKRPLCLMNSDVTEADLLRIPDVCFDTYALKRSYSEERVAALAAPPDPAESPTFKTDDVLRFAQEYDYVSLGMGTYVRPVFSSEQHRIQGKGKKNKAGSAKSRDSPSPSKKGTPSPLSEAGKAPPQPAKSNLEVDKNEDWMNDTTLTAAGSSEMAWRLATFSDGHPWIMRYFDFLRNQDYQSRDISVCLPFPDYKPTDFVASVLKAVDDYVVRRELVTSYTYQKSITTITFTRKDIFAAFPREELATGVYASPNSLASKISWDEELLPFE